MFKKVTYINLEIPMNKDTLKGQWQQLKGKVKQKWGELTDDDFSKLDGSHDELLGKIRERYGYDKERAEKELKSFYKENDLE